MIRRGVVSLGIFTVCSLAIGSTNSFAHGEDKPGPHGGFVRMPGALHTEVLAISDTEFQIYLLDVEWKNPTIEGSSVTAKLKRGVKEIQLECSPIENRFSCRTPKGEKHKKKDELQVTANRKGISGNVASYKLPLKLEKSVVDHSQH